MSDPRSVNEKITKMSEILGIVCDELKVGTFMQVAAVSYLQTQRDACIRAYDRVMKALETR